MMEMKASPEQGPLRFVKGGTLIDGTGRKPVKDPVIVLQGRRIKQVGTKQSVKIPPQIGRAHV